MRGYYGRASVSTVVRCPGAEMVLGQAGTPERRRRRTGIEPARDRVGLSPVLKTATSPTR